MSYEAPFPTPEPSLATVKRCAEACHAVYAGTSEDGCGVVRHVWRFGPSGTGWLLALGAELHAAGIAYCVMQDARIRPDGSAMLVEIEARCLHGACDFRAGLRQADAEERALVRAGFMSSEEVFR